MHFVVLHATENPYQHVEEVNADIGGDPAGFAFVPLPGGEVPVAPGSDVREVDDILFPCRSLPDLLSQSDDGRMDPELEDVVDPLPRFPFQLGPRHRIYPPQKRFPFSLIAFMWRGAMYPDDPIREKFLGVAASPTFILPSIRHEVLVLCDRSLLGVSNLWYPYTGVPFDLHSRTIRNVSGYMPFPLGPCDCASRHRQPALGFFLPWNANPVSEQ